MRRHQKLFDEEVGLQDQMLLIHHFEDFQKFLARSEEKDEDATQKYEEQELREGQ